MSLLKQHQKIVREYRRTEQPWPASSKDIAEWAIQNDKWQMYPSAIIKRCTEDIAAAMREEYFTDDSGRRVRLYHPARIKKQGELFTEWDDIRSASRLHMQLSFQQHRRKITGECRQLKIDLDSYNEAHHDDEPMQISFNFEMDIAEFEAADAA